MQNNQQTGKKMKASIIAIVILSLCLCITTFALVWSMAWVNDNIFSTGKIDIDLNDGKPVIEEDEYLFKPGMEVIKEFYIQNNSTCEAYYKIYFDEITGGLADVIEVTIRDNQRVLFAGKPSELTKQMVSSADEPLRLKEKKELEISFYYPKEGNSTQDATLTFTLCADAVQMKNNPNREFD